MRQHKKWRSSVHGVEKKMKINKQLLLTKIRCNKFFRTVFMPINIIYHLNLGRRYVRSESAAQMKLFENKHRGKRCFVIGNGPSLTPADLDKIRGEFSFGTNRIYHIFDQTKWRPTYYMCLDNNVIAVDFENIEAIGDYPKFLNFKSARYFKKSDNMVFVFSKGKYHIDPYKPQADSLSNDMSKYSARVHTVTVSAIELAIYMGFKEIYLLGVDHSYANTVDSKGKIHRDSTVKADYFAGMKGAGSTAGAKEIVSNVDAMNYSYELAKEFAEQKGVKIINATRGGRLEIFERVDFDELMERTNRLQ